MHKITDESSKLELLNFQPTVVTDHVVDSLITKFQQRSLVGQAKYGTTLHSNNKDNYFNHLQQELMDASLYLEKLLSKLQHTFISSDHHHLIYKGVVYSIGDTIYKNNEPATIIGFALNVEDMPPVTVYTTLGYADINLISHEYRKD